MHTTTPDWTTHIDRALVAMANVAADFAAAGFGDIPFGIEASDLVDDMSPGDIMASCRKPDLDSAHRTLLWETTWKRACQTLKTEAGPLLHALRAALPVLTGPMGCADIQHRQATKNSRARVFVYVNGVALDNPNIHEGLADFAQKVAHLRPTTGERVSCDGYSRPMLGANVEEHAIFCKAVGTPSYV